jgi:PKHD-type hydroxylase
MLLIEGLMTKAKVDELNKALAQVAFVPGQRSGGIHGSLIKNNLEHDRDDPNYARASAMVFNAVMSSPALHGYAFPSKLTPIIFARYSTDMGYGDHVDSAVQVLQNLVVRTDISMTLFLTEPDEYDGGELVVNVMGTELAVKSRAGDVFLYPTGVTHRVNPVRRGERKVAVTWFQSLIADHELRAILHDLHNVRNGLFNPAGLTREFKLVNSACENLLRIFTQP